MRLRRPRQWGACWLAMVMWDQPRLDDFWRPALPPSREGTDWLNVLKTLVAYRLISPGSEWWLHRHWFEHSAMGDLLGEDAGLAQPNNLYRCLDLLVAHKPALFTFLRERWKSLFQADFEVLLYDLTSTYFECDPPESGKRKFGYSRDKRSDCVQVVIALIVTPDGLPLAYEVMDGNTSDKTTLRAFLTKIETQYGSAKRTWVMDRGIPTEEVLAEMRGSPTPIRYLVGAPRGRLTKLEQALAAKPWEEVRESVRVKLIEQDGETYVLARSESRRDKEQGMRRRRLRKLIKRLRELQRQDLTRDELLLKLGAAKKEAGKAYGLLVIHTPTKDQPVTPQTFHFALDRKKLRLARRREGGYLLRSNIRSDDPGHLWLSAIGRDRASVQATEERSVDSSQPSPVRRPDRSSYLRRLPGLRSDGHVEAAAEGAGAGADAEGCARKACRHPNDRRRVAHDRRPHGRPVAPYRAGRRSAALAAAPEARPPRPAAAEDHGSDPPPSGLIAHLL